MAESKYYTISEKVHEKKGTVIYVVRLEDKVSRKIFNELSDLARNHGGYYSSYSGVNGFVFPTREDAELFGTEVDNTHKSMRKKKSVKSDEEELIEILKGQYSEEPTSASKPTRTEASDYDYTGALPLHEALRRVIKCDGDTAITDIITVNILNDFQAYKDCPSAKYVLRSFIADGYGKRFLSAGSWGNKTLQLINKFIAETGFQQSVVDLVFQSIAFGLGWLNEVSQSPTSPVQPNTSSQQKPVLPPKVQQNFDATKLTLRASQLNNKSETYIQQYKIDVESYLDSIIEIKGSAKTELGIDLRVFSCYDTGDGSFSIHFECSGKFKINVEYSISFEAVIYDNNNRLIETISAYIEKKELKKNYFVKKSSWIFEKAFKNIANVNHIIVYWEVD